MTFQATYLTPRGAVRRMFTELPEDREIQSHPAYADAVRVRVEEIPAEMFAARFDRQQGFVYCGLVER